MSMRPLKSDQVNYLIWRYLQESGHAQTAARLQRDWGRGDPEKLAFAPLIRTHALVHLLQKGLRYHELETSFDQNGNQRPPSYFFGPDGTTASPTPGATHDDDAASDTSRKHPRDSWTNGLTDGGLQPPSAKRSRRGQATNGSTRGRSAAVDTPDGDAADTAPKREPGTATSTRAPSPSAAATAAHAGDMDVDEPAAAKLTAGSPAIHQPTKVEDGDAPAPTAIGAKTPAEASPAPVIVIPTLTNGASIGVQSDKVADLAPDTAVLSVPGTRITHALWSPRDPTLLAAAGDALCRLWTIPTATRTRNQSPHPNGGPRQLVPSRTVDLYGAGEGFYVTAMAWSPDGESIAIAKHNPDATGVVSIYDKAGMPLDDLPGGTELLVSLLWNPTGTLLLGISRSDEDESTVMMWDAVAARPIEPLRVQRKIAAAAWTDANSFVVCGTGVVASSTVQMHRLAPLAFRTEIRDADWSHIEHDLHTSTTITTADGVPAAMGAIGSDGRWHDTVAHEAEITALCFQPLANAAGVRNDPTQRRLYATAATDGKVKVWDARRPFECVHTLELGKGEPALAISFTPDGYLVAAASADKVLFWNADAGGPPKAAWNGRAIADTVNGAHTNGEGAHGVANGDVEMRDGADEEEDSIPSLSWDVDGGKLAHGAKSQIAIISFRR